MIISLEDSNCALYWHKREGRFEAVKLWHADEDHEGLALLVQGLKGSFKQVEPGDLILYPRGKRTFEVWPRISLEREATILAEITHGSLKYDISLYVYGRDLK